MTRVRTLVVAAAAFAALVGGADVEPAAVYRGGYDAAAAPVRLRIANGGAGESGLLGGACRITPPFGPRRTDGP